MAIKLDNASQVMGAPHNVDPLLAIKNNTPELAPVCGGLDNVSHFLSLETSNSYIAKWKEYQLHVKNTTDVSIISLLVKKIGGLFFGSYQKSVNVINRTMLINYEKFSLNPEYPHSNSLKQLLGLSLVLEIHIGIKPITDQARACWDGYAKSQNPQTFNSTKTEWYGKDQMQCVIFIGKDLNNNILTISIP